MYVGLVLRVRTDLDVMTVSNRNYEYGPLAAKREASTEEWGVLFRNNGRCPALHSLLLSSLILLLVPTVPAVKSSGQSLKGLGANHHRPSIPASLASGHADVPRTETHVWQWHRVFHRRNTDTLAQPCSSRPVGLLPRGER